MTSTKRIVQSIFLLTLFLIPDIFAQYENYWDGIPAEIKEKNFYKRYEWFYRPRTNEQGILPLEHFREQMKIEKQKITQESKSKFSEVMGTSDLWTNIGPKGIDMTAGSGFVGHWGTVSGRIRGLAVHPTDENIVYIGAAAGGIWKTADGGTSWSDVSGDLTLLTFGAIAIDPNNPNTVYAGTGEARYSFNQQTYEGDGLYKTTDGGSNWTKITSGIGTITQIADIQVSPHNSNHIMMALAAGNYNRYANYGYNSNEGVWRSTDGGSSWSRVLSEYQAFDVAYHPTNSDSVYAIIGGAAVGTTPGFYLSTNSGSSFTRVTSGGFPSSNCDRAQIALAPSRPNVIYAFIYDASAGFTGSRQSAVYKSTDGGANWSIVSSGANLGGTYNGSTVSDQGSYDLCIDVSPTDDDSVYIGNVEMSMTSNGSTFLFVRDASGPYSGTRAWDCPIHVDIHKIVYAPSRSKYIYASCDGGIYRSTDGGANWTHLNNSITTLQFYRVASHPTNSSVLYGGAQDNGAFSTTDKGTTDWNFDFTGDGMECFVDYNTPSNVFMSAQTGSIYRSTDSGVNWSYIAPTYTTNSAWTAPYWQDPSDHNNIFVFSNKLWKSTNKGTNWTAISADITTDGDGITTAAQSSVTSNNMMAVESRFTSSPELFKSTDGGANWTSVTASYDNDKPSSVPILRVVADITSGTTFYVCRASYGSGQIMKTTDLGSNWTDFSGDLPSVPTNDIFIDPDNTNHIYVANDFGVYWSSNGGTNYTKLSNGMPFLPAMDFDLFDDNTNRYLRVATHGRGVYELNIDSPLPVELISFMGELNENSVFLNWETATETNNYGFEIERGLTEFEFEKIGFVLGNGTTNSPKSYSFTDDELPNANEVWYKLKQIDNDGQYNYSKTIRVDISAITGIEDESKELKFELSQNYPNPFNPATQISFSLLDQSQVTITVVNTLGQIVKTLINSEIPAGKHEILFNAEDLSSGIYFYTIQAKPMNGGNTFVASKKMILLK